MTFPTFFTRVAALLAALAIGTAIAQAPRDITPLAPPQPVENDGKVEVLEFFAYGCIHCAHLEPKLNEWAGKQPADVKVKRIPAAFAVRGIDSIPLFYTLEAMGLQEKLHQKIFDAANVENVILGNPATLNKWLEKQGVDPKKYEEMQKSFSVQNKINRARNLTTAYKINATPMLVVDGRYLLEQTGSTERMLANADQLIEQTRAKFKSTAAPAAAPAAKPAAAPAKK
jgi:thiol:disulfide interchange protein DsbA